MANLGAELAMVACAFGIYFAYHIFFFVLYGSGLRTTKVGKGHTETKYNDLFNKGKIARITFSDMMCDENDTICGIQQNRNGLIAVSFLAGTASLMAQKVLSILLTEEQLDQIERYGVCFSDIHVSFPSCKASKMRWLQAAQAGLFHLHASTSS